MTRAEQLFKLLTDLKKKLARGDLSYAEAVGLEDLITTIERSIARAVARKAERPGSTRR